MTDAFGFAPQLRVDGPIDTAVDTALCDNVLAVVRESLSNAAQHAQARSLDVTVYSGDSRVTVEVVDDGVGVGEATPRGGLANMRGLAEDLGGAFDLRPGPHARGTLVHWSVPAV
jgi:signal transduction histidine kinase